MNSSRTLEKETRVTFEEQELITGGTTGIGSATARRFVAKASRVAITGNDPARREQAKAQLGPMLAIRSDAGDIAGQRVVAKAVGDAFGALDIAVLSGQASSSLTVA